MATANEINEIIKLYVGYYNRAPDPLGLNFWIGAFDGGFGLDAMAVDFSTQAETVANYPFFENDNPSVEELGTFVDSVYQNLFNRNPDEAGREFWSTKIESGEFSVGEAISLIIAGATTSPDQEVVANKVAVGLDFYNDLNAVAPTYEFQQDDVDEATAIQAGVTEDTATIAVAAAQTDTYVANFDDGSGTTINLTTNTDVPGGSGQGADTQGGSGSDIYQGTVEQGGAGTLQSADSLAAGGGNDTLNVRLVAGASTFLFETIALNATDLENIVVTDQLPFGGFFNLDLDAVTGESSLTASGGTFGGQISFLNVDEGTSLRMVDLETDLIASFKGDRAASSEDTFSLYVEDTGTENARPNLFLNDENGNRDEEFEIANIETGGSTESFVNAPGLALDSITVTGSQKLNLTDTQDGFEELEVLDASGMSGGGVFLDASGNTEATFAFTGSSSNDELVLSNTKLSSGGNFSLDGGDGTDTLTLGNFNSNTVSAINDASGFEILSAQNASTTLEAEEYNNIDTFVFEAQSTNGNRLNVRGVTDDDLFIFERDAGRTDEFIRFEADSVGQSLTFEMRATSEDEGQIEFVADGNNNSSSAIGFTGSSTFDDVTISSTGANEDANLILSLGTGGTYAAFDNQDGPTNFNITGGQALTIAAAEGVALTSSTDERGFTNSVNLDGSSATGDLRIAGSSGDDAIEGGSGDDIIYGLSGDDVLTGNDGDDQFRISNFSGTDELQDFTSGDDKVGLNQVDFGNTTATEEGAILNSEDYVENLQGIANMTGAEDEKLVELQTAASQTQIEDTTTNTSLEAYVMVYNSTTEQGELWFDDDWADTNNRDHVATFDDVTSLTELTGFSNTDFVEYLF